MYIYIYHKSIYLSIYLSRLLLLMEEILNQPPGMYPKTLYLNHGISTTLPSTGEFTGFLNHQSVSTVGALACHFLQLLAPIILDKNHKGHTQSWPLTDAIFY